jgi:hypothetical protein
MFDPVKAFWLRAFQAAPTAAPSRVVAPAVAVGVAVCSAASTGVSFFPNMYSPLSLGVPSGLELRHAYCRVPRSLRSLRCWHSRRDKMRTE